MTYTDQFIEYLTTATTPVQSVSENICRLEEEGFEVLDMKDAWRIEAGCAYYVRPFPTTLIAFKVGINDYEQHGFKIITSHTDNPCFKVKPNPEKVTQGYVQLNTEIYSPPMFYTWLDRPLSLGGHVVLKSENPLKPLVAEVDFLYPLMTIPSLAVHYNRTVNTEGAKFNPQKEMLPIIGVVKDSFEKEGYLNKLLAEEVDCEASEILDYDLYLYIKEDGLRIGAEGDLVSAPRVDNQASVFGSIQALIEAKPEKSIALAACFDNEEVGSLTKQGADSTLLYQITERIGMALHRNNEMMYRMWNNSFMVSADGAHGVHPNYMEKNDVTNFPVLNGGIVIKSSAKQSYMTDGISSGIFKQICEQAEVPYQTLVNRSDIPGGKTLGPLAAKYMPMQGVDVGIPMLAMHSARELFGASDFEDMVKVFKYFYNL